MNERWFIMHDLGWFKKHAFSATIDKELVYFQNRLEWHEHISGKSGGRRTHVTREMIHTRFWKVVDHTINGGYYVSENKGEYCPIWIMEGIFTRKSNPEKFI